MAEVIRRGLINILQGAEDPTAGAGVAAPTGSLFIRTNTLVYQKLAGADTNWTVLASSSSGLLATYKTQRTGATLSTNGVDKFLKMRYPIYASSTFVRVYKDGVIMTFGADYDFNPGPGGAKIGSIADITDGVRFLVATVAGSTYRLEYDEYASDITPPIFMWRNDNGTMRRGNFLFRTPAAAGVPSGAVMTAGITKNSAFSYTAHYGAIDVTKTYADRLGVALFDKGADIPTMLGAGWRLEVYKFGKKTAPDGGNTTDRLLMPFKTSTTNGIALDASPFITGGALDHIRSGHYIVRLRNTVSNSVTRFSPQRMYLRRFGVRSGTYAASFGHYNKSGII